MANLKTPPHNTDAEQSVLGAILIDKEAISTASEILDPSDFYDNNHQTIFEAMIALYEERSPIDLVTLTAALKKTSKNKGAKNSIETSYLTDLVNAVPTAANVENYARIIKDASIKRSLIKISSEVTTLALDDEKAVREVLDVAESSVFAISQGNTIRGFIPIKQSLAASFDRIDELHKSGAGLRGVKTGFTDLDTLLVCQECMQNYKGNFMQQMLFPCYRSEFYLL